MKASISPEIGRHWPKRLARLMFVSVPTAKDWIYKGVPATRRQEIAQALLDECDRLEAIIADTRKRWEREAARPLAGCMGDQALEADRALREPITESA